MDYREIKKIADESRDFVHQMMAKDKLNKDEELQVLAAAYSVLHQWNRGGTPIQMARGHWLVCRVLCFLGEIKLAQQHATLCDFYTKSASDRKDFDEAYAIEALARSAALRGDLEAAKKNKIEAKRLGTLISDPIERKNFEERLKSMSWYGVD